MAWFWFGPILYTDTAELWIADRAEKLAVDVAGIYVELIIAGSLSLWSYFSHQPVLSTYLWLYSLAIYFTAFKNLSPVREYDGYLILADMLDNYRLRKQAIDWLLNLLPLSFDKMRILGRHKAEELYWIATCIYLLLSTFIVFLILQLIFKMLSIESFLNLSTRYISLAVAMFLLFLAVRSLWREIKAYEIRQHD